MTRLEAQGIIENRLGQRTGLGSAIVEELKLAQVRHEQAPTLPWFLLASATPVTVADTQTVAVPTGYIRDWDEGGLFYTDSEGEQHEIQKKDYNMLKRDPDFAVTGAPQYYALVGSSYYLFPTPDAVYNLSTFYYKNAALLAADNTENSWLLYAPEVLLNAAGIQMARFYRDEAAISIFSMDYAEAVRRMEEADVARREAAVRRFIGG